MSDKSILYHVKSNEFEFTFTKEEVEAADVVRRSPVDFNLIKDLRSVNAKLLEADHTFKHQTIEVEGENYTVEIKDELELQLETMGFNEVSNKHIKEIKAPMPGQVLEISVVEGQEVAADEKILILVAMKMENSILVHTKGVIKRVAVIMGQAVEKGQVLVELE